jgi:5-methylcytosine-specific restriction endonuclease McrA
MSYRDSLKDPRWQSKRSEILYRDKNTCQKCGDPGNQVHHLQYIDGHEPWEYDNDDLQTLCDDCHNIESSLIKWTKYERMKKKLCRQILSPDEYENGIKIICDFLLI